MGTGPRDMIRRCVAAELPEPEFAVTDRFVTTVWREIALKTGKALGGQVAGQVTGQVTDEVSRVVFVLHGEQTRRQLQSALQLKGRDNFEERYLKPAIKAGYIALTIPEKPRSRLQKYRLTEKGRKLIQKLQKTK